MHSIKPVMFFTNTVPNLVKPLIDLNFNLI